MDLEVMAPLVAMIPSFSHSSAAAIQILAWLLMVNRISSSVKRKVVGPVSPIKNLTESLGLADGLLYVPIAFFYSATTKPVLSSGT